VSTNCELYSASRSRREQSLVSVLPSNGDLCRLFCFHHAGGGGANFRRWPRLIDPLIQVGTVVLPGRERLLGLAPFTDFVTAVEQICNELRRISIKPFALFGHSLGAALAFEVTYRLEQQGSCSPFCLIVSGRGALHLPDSPSNRSGGGECPNSALPDAEFISLLEEMGGTPPEILSNSEMLRFLLPVIRADFRLSEDYHWDGKSKVRCPVLVLGGNGDEYAKELAAWRDLTTGEVTLHIFDGGHFFTMTKEEEVCKVVANFVQQQCGLLRSRGIEKSERS
jgi:medium-chain acyl-[acyl-carrier-protein] hydrolase